MTAPWLTWVLGTILCLLEATLLPYLPDGVVFQVWVSLTVWLGMQKDWTVAGLVLAGLFFPIEWSASGRMGLISLGLVVVFGMIRASGMSASALRLVGVSVLGALAAAAHGLVMCGMLLVFDPSSPLISSIVWTLGQSAVAGALVTPVVVGGMVRLNEVFSPRSRFGVGRR